MRMFSRFALACGAAAMLLVASAAHADVVLTDGNSTAVINPTSQQGMYSWTVDGHSQLYQQWFWYRVGSSGPEHSIDTLTLTSQSSSANSWTGTYTGNGFTITTSYTLLGGLGGTGTADIAEVIRINNTGTAPLDFHFFQYSDFDLDGTTGGDSVALSGNNTWVQSSDIATLSETSGIPSASHAEAGYYHDTLDRLNDGLATTLNDTTSAGPGDVTWAWQWDRTLGAGGSLIISKDKHLQTVPVPGAVLLALVGLSLVGWLKRRIA